MMLAQNFQRNDAETLRRKGRNFRAVEGVVNDDALDARSYKFSFLTFASLLLCVFALNLSCTSKPSEMRALVPAESLVYLETNDLAAALQPIIDSKPFTEAAKKKPDLSVLKGVQMAVAVLGFEATEEKLTDEQSVGSVKPRFVAVVDTHAWNYQANAFAEQKLGAFVADIYGGEPKLEKSDKGGGKYYAWSADDGKKAFALVIDSIVYFANDETAIDKCLAVRRGESDSIIKNDKIKPIEPTTLARGYITNDGVNQIAALVGMKLASEASDESEIQSAIAGILPQLIRGTVTDVTWTMTKGDQGIEDKYQVGMPQDVANVFSEIARPSSVSSSELLKKIPEFAMAVTVYNFEEPNLVWQNVISQSQKLMGPQQGKVFAEALPLFFEPYGIRDPSAFFGSVSKSLVATKLVLDHEEPFVVARTKGTVKPESFVDTDIKATKENWSDTNFKKWQSDDASLAVAYDGSILLLGDKDGISRRIDDPKSENFSITPQGQKLSQSNASIVSYGYDDYPSSFIPTFTNDTGGYDGSLFLDFSTETRFTKSGMERRTVSDFGLIGQIIAQLADN